jgi:predicted nucleic acid-binding protein
MIVVGDTGPLNYLVLIGQVDILPSLFSRVVIPRAVASELESTRAPGPVRRWIGNPPTWLDIHPDPVEDGTMTTLDFGERAAITLALLINAPQILMDDKDGRIEAERRNLKVTGTLGIVVEAHLRGLLDFDSTLARLSKTSFYLSPRLVAMIRRLL